MGADGSATVASVHTLVSIRTYQRVGVGGIQTSGRILLDSLVKFLKKQNVRLVLQN